MAYLSFLSSVSTINGPWHLEQKQRVVTLRILSRVLYHCSTLGTGSVNREGSLPVSLPLTFIEVCFDPSSRAHTKPEEEITYLCDYSQQQINQHLLLESKRSYAVMQEATVIVKKTYQCNQRCSMYVHRKLSNQDGG